MITDIYKQKADPKKVLKSSLIDTKLGKMIAIGDEKDLYFLDFADKQGLEDKIERFRRKAKVIIVSGISNSIKSIAQELTSYFDGLLEEFKTPIYLVGSVFQKRSWNQLMYVPYGQTIAYAAQATSIGKPTAYRAVANANGANHIAIVIPCHRIITSSGNIGGYGGGIARKQWLIDHEKSINKKNFK